MFNTESLCSFPGAIKICVRDCVIFEIVINVLYIGNVGIAYAAAPDAAYFISSNNLPFQRSVRHGLPFIVVKRYFQFRVCLPFYHLIDAFCGF